MDSKALDRPTRGRGPAPKYGNPTFVKSIRTPEVLWDQIGELADRHGITRNELIVQTMQRKVKRDL